MDTWNKIWNTWNKWNYKKYKEQNTWNKTVLVVVVRLVWPQGGVETSSVG